MELRMHSVPGAHRHADWTAAAVSGLAAGAVLMVIELFWSATQVGSSPWDPSHMIAAIVMGPDVLQSSSFSVGVVGIALITHYLLGIVFGLVLGALMTSYHLDGNLYSAQLIGALFGMVLYVVNFYGVEILFPWFAEARNGANFVGHMIFGMTAAVLYWKFERRDTVH